MSIQAPQIETYLYADLDGLNQIKLTDSGGGPITFSLGSTQTVSDALTDWATQGTADATLSGIYTFAWLPALQTVSFLCSENFTLDLLGELPAALGFSSASHSGSTSYTSDLTPLALANPINIDYQPPWAAEETQLGAIRWGRITSHFHYSASLTRIATIFDADAWADLETGPLLTSRAVYYPCGYTSGFHSATNLRGALDVYPYEWAEARPLGNLESDPEIIVIGAIAE